MIPDDDGRVIVHADGGDCHGTPLVDGRCPGCGIAPDMQSCELWHVTDPDINRGPSTRVRLDLFELQHLADFAGNVDDAEHRAEWERLTRKLEAGIVRLGAEPISRNSTR